MKILFKKMIVDLLDSFDSDESTGYSPRKLTSWWTVMLITILDIGYVKYVLFLGKLTGFIYILGLHMLFVCILLGLITAEQIIKYKGTKEGVIQNDNLPSENQEEKQILND